MSDVPQVKSDRSGDGPIGGPGGPGPGPGAGTDPRLAIPEVLQRPVHVAGVTDKKERPPSERLGGLGEVGKALAIGLDFLATAAAGGVIGWLADRWLGTSPRWLVVGAIVGFVGATFRLLRRLNK